MSVVVLPSRQVSLYSSLDSVHDPDPRASFVAKKRFDHDFNSVASLMITDNHIQNGTDLRGSTDPSFHLR